MEKVKTKIDRWIGHHRNVSKKLGILFIKIYLTKKTNVWRFLYVNLFKITFELKNTIYDTVAHCILIDQYIYLHKSYLDYTK